MRKFLSILLLVFGAALAGFAQKNAADSTLTGTYSGGLKMGMKHGKGTFTWPDGGKYSGYWRNDLMEGQGTYTAPDGTNYTGNWLGGKRTGYGVYTWPNGDKYAGEWRNDMKSGLGKLTLADGSSHEGEWLADQANGYGTHIWASGTKYMGDWKNNKRHGQGVMAYRDGRLEQGDWKDDEYVPCKCSSDSIASVAATVQVADIVFAGKISEFVDYGGTKLALVNITELWKGKPTQGHTVLLKVGMSSCDWIWFKGEEYLFYAKEVQTGIFATSRCTRTQLLARATADLPELNKLPCESQTAEYVAPGYQDSDPVCGCDGITYRNAKDALRNRVLRWKAGRCPNK